jgi:hypothetical protein
MRFEHNLSVPLHISSWEILMKQKTIKVMGTDSNSQVYPERAALTLYISLTYVATTKSNDRTEAIYPRN